MNYMIIFIGLIGATQIAMAVPQKFSKCDIRSRISMPSEASAHFMSDDCRTVYVLPPTEGAVTVDSVSTDLNSDLCSISRGALDQIKSASDNVRSLRKRLNDEIAKVENQDGSMVELAERCTQLRNNYAVAQVQVDAFENESAAIGTQISTLRKKIESCEKEKGAEDPKCHTLKTRLERLESKQEKAEARIEKVQPVLARYRSASESCDKMYAEQRTRSLNSNTSISTAQANLLKAETALQNVLETQIAKEREASGAIVNLTVKMKMVDLLNKYKQANNRLVKEGISFEALPIKTMSMNFLGVKNGVDAGYPVVREQSILGKSASRGGLGLEQIETADSKDMEKLFQGAASGYVVINRLAACDLSRSKSGDPKQISVKDVADFLRPAVRFEYEVQSGKSYSVKYSENHLYQLIKEQSTQGGLFSTSGSNRVLERSQASKWLQIEFTSESSDNAWDEPEKMAAEIRASYLDAAVTKKAKEYLQTEADVEFYAPGQTNGAKVASGALKKCPNVYCQAAAVVFDFTDAVFGGQTNTAEMTRILSAQDSVFVNIEKIVLRTGGITFKAIQE